MKKYTLLVLILIVLVGVFSPIAQVSATETYADCVSRYMAQGFTDTEAANSCKNIVGASTPADACADIEGIGNIICQIHKILNLIIPALIALAVIYFIWGVVQYVIRDSEEAKKKGKDHIIYGIIGLAIVVGLWGVVGLLQNSFGLGGGSPPALTTPTESDGTTSICPPGSLFLEDNPKLQDLLEYATCIIFKSVVPLIFALAVAMFVWGVTKYVINSSDEAKKEKGRQFMLWGVIALAVMFSIWGLVGIFGATVGIDSVIIPQVQPKS